MGRVDGEDDFGQRPLMAGKKGAIHRPAIVRWAEKVQPMEEGLGCWLWAGSIDSSGYGMFAFQGRAWRAHRWGWTYIVGPIAEGMELDHWCLIRACVFPPHLEEVTGRENLRRSFLARTHCRNGHPYDDVRIDVDPITGGRHRFCRYCKRDWYRRSREKDLGK